MLAFILLQTLLIGTPQELSTAAESLHDPYVVYEAGYQNIDYPCGDIQPDQGVCTAVIVRGFKRRGRCLQQEMHEFRLSKGVATDKANHHTRGANNRP